VADFFFDFATLLLTDTVYPTNTGRNAMRKSMMVCSALVMVAGAATAGELPKEGKVNGATY